MDNYQESVLMAFVVVVLVSVPAASQNVEISGKEEGVIDSLFSDRFEADFKSGKEFLDLKDSEARLEVNRSFDKNVKLLQTATGYFKVVKTNSSIDKVVNTPYGRFEFGVDQGESYSRFEGDKKSEAEDIRSDLEELMDEKEKEVNEKRDIVVEELLPDVDLEVEDDTDIEHFNLTNNGENAVDMSGWSVITKGSGRDSYNLTRTIESGETITYYSGSDDINLSGNQVDVDTTVYSNTNGDGSIQVYNHVDKLVNGVEDY